MKSRRQNKPRVLHIIFLAGMFICSYARPARAQLGFLKKKSNPTQVQSSTEDYLTRARATNTDEAHTLGSLWTRSSTLAIGSGDYKARRAGDLLTIKVVDNFSSTNTGSTSGQRAFSASSSVGAFIGTVPATSRLQSLFSPTSAQNISGKGASALTSTLTLSLAARVIEALPNGVLVVEATRDFAVGNDRQTIVVRGLVRPGDIAADDSVLSTAVANLEAKIQGKGIVADAIRQPNIVVRTLEKLLSF